jgi:hypothetical protein
MIMKFATNSTINAKRLFVPVNEFEFNSFVVRVRRLASRPTRRLRGEFPVSQGDSSSIWAPSPIPAVL